MPSLSLVATALLSTERRPQWQWSERQQVKLVQPARPDLWEAAEAAVCVCESAGEPGTACGARSGQQTGGQDNIFHLKLALVVWVLYGRQCP